MEDRADLKRKISTLLLKVDPMRIYFKDCDNQDEYDPEADELARLLPSCVSREACLGAVQEVFQRYFGDLIVSRAGNFEALADELWELRRELYGS
jgi:hypothetical protein